MSLIARCPACQTLFKVVSDQLRVSGGWVRCGQCEEVFDARQHLLSQAPEPAVRQADEKPEPEPPAKRSDEASIELTPSPPDPIALAVPYKTEFLAPEPGRRTELGEVAFLRGKDEKSYRNKPILRAVLTMVSAALMVGLIGQVVVHERNRIAALQPGLRPLLQSFCRPLNCSMSALQDKNSIVIDSASFAKIVGDSYRLLFTLKNTAATALAVPAVELTLTDTADQPVLRRVFLPAELDLDADTLAAHSERPTSLAMAVSLASTGQQIVGYRLYAFYP